MSIIQVHNLIKRYGTKTVLQLDDWQVQAGEFVALIGPNGAGKTTLLRVLASLARPTRGEVRLAGQPLPSERRSLGVVTHQTLLYSDLTPEGNLRFYGRLYGVPQLEKRIQQVLEQAGLLQRRDDPVRTLSRGMQQRLAIGRAVLHDPQVLLLDEPHTGLDQDAARMLDDTLRAVCENGRTVVMTTHDLTRASALATRFDVLVQGRIRASAHLTDLPALGLPHFYQETLS